MLFQTKNEVTPEEVEKKFPKLTDWQRGQLDLARVYGKPVSITVIDIEGEEILYEIGVFNA